MKSSCETRQEFMTSKLMFKKFLNSKQIKSTLVSPFIDSVQKFVTKHIEPHESTFCFYLRLNLRHFDIYTNSIHEGTNRGLKHDTALVDPSTEIEKTIATICNNAEHNGKRKSRVASIDFRGTKVYSKLQCANKLIPIGECILSQNWINRLSQKSLKISPSKWLVTYDYNSDSHRESETLSPLPRLKRIREVNISNGYIYCSCKYHSS